MVGVLGARRRAHHHSDGGNLSALSDEFAALLGCSGIDPTWAAGGVVGLEHEYEVRLQGIRVSFRELIQELALGQRNLDPADPNAYRLPSGTALTADEDEAELALPPTTVRPGFGAALAQAATGERRRLEGLLPAGCVLTGYSTHLSVAVPDPWAESVARLYARTFAPALMLLMDEVTSPGLLVRPRPGRVELGGEYVDDARLAAAALFAVGSVRYCLNVVVDGRRPTAPVLDVNLRPDDRRYGWFVGRDAFGGDLYLTGRQASLPLAAGGTVVAQHHLETCWCLARSALGAEISAEGQLVDHAVFGSHPLPGRPPPTATALPVSSADLTTPFGSLLYPGPRPGYELAPVMMSWERAVFVLATPDRTRKAFAHVPGPNLGPFQAGLDNGDLDQVTQCYLATAPAQRRLDRRSRTVAGLYDELGHRVQLLAPERAAVRSRRVRQQSGRRTG